MVYQILVVSFLPGILHAIVWYGATHPQHASKLGVDETTQQRCQFFDDQALSIVGLLAHACVTEASSL